MSISEERTENASIPKEIVIENTAWENFGENTYVCDAVICPEVVGGFSIHALKLPGASSQGETIEEAIENISDAFQGIIQSYIEDEEEIPWEDAEIENIPKGSIKVQVLVDV